LNYPAGVAKRIAGFFLRRGGRNRLRTHTAEWYSPSISMRQRGCDGNNTGNGRAVETVERGGKYALLPYVRKISAAAGADWMPAAWDRFWQEASPYACVLMSEKDERWGARLVSCRVMAVCDDFQSERRGYRKRGNECAV